MAANWIPSSPVLGLQNIEDTSTVRNHAFGLICQANHATLGAGEFIYLQGIGSTIVGSVVTYNAVTGATALAPVGTGIPNPVAVAMSANVANQYGWYQIGGLSRASITCATSMAAGIAVGIKTVGKVATSGSLKELQGAVVGAVHAANSGVLVTLNLTRPHMQGRVT